MNDRNGLPVIWLYTPPGGWGDPFETPAVVRSWSPKRVSSSRISRWPCTAIALILRSGFVESRAGAWRAHIVKERDNE